MNTGNLTETTPKLTVSVQEAARMLGIGRATAYEGVRTGVIPSVKVGRRLLVPRVALERMLAGVGEANGKGKEGTDG